jgi:hypothetical protein
VSNFHNVLPILQISVGSHLRFGIDFGLKTGAPAPVIRKAGTPPTKKARSWLTAGHYVRMPWRA